MHSARLTHPHCAWQAAVLAAVRAAGFTSTRVLVPHEMPLRVLTNAFRSSSLLLTAHGSGMINQVYESVGKYEHHALMCTLRPPLLPY